MKRSLFPVVGIFFWALFISCAPFASFAAFVPEQPVMAVNRVRPGMRGYMLTVLKGMKPVRLPIEIVSVIPQKGSSKNAIMIRMLPSAEK